ncbi:PIN domain-containing protein [Deltaproteobacteria bacterium TL4]
MNQDMVYFSEATWGELIFGAERSQKRESNLLRIRLFQKAVPSVSIDQEIWSIFGQTKALLSLQGKVVPDMDLLIASTAKRYELTLVSNDQHMQSLPASFLWENWSNTLHSL